MPLKENWEHLNVPLPEIQYRIGVISGQGKGSTTWAAHSHTPMDVQLWLEFDNLVASEGKKDRNREKQDIDFHRELQTISESFDPVSIEEDVTFCVKIVLNAFSKRKLNLSGGIGFRSHNQQIIGNPDIVALERDDRAFGIGPLGASPPAGQRAEIRRKTTELIQKKYRFPFETKPEWNFRFLENTDSIIDNWGIPENFDAEKMQAEVSLPDTWSADKEKVFHLVRQIYGQMVSDNRRYGIIHTYEKWFFCKRCENGILRISRVFRRTQTSPSIFQAIKTMIGFDDYHLDNSAVHPKSAQKAKTKKKADDKWGEGTNMVTSLQQWEWDVFDYTDHVLLLTTKKDPTIIAKMQIDPKKHHVANEMANEAAMYEALESNSVVRNVIPRFCGHSRSWGVSLSCFGKEFDDFDDIGLENLSDKLKDSAVRAMEVLSEAGILHNDIELRNIVQSKEDPNCAKIIDFGRATFSSDSKQLAKQVDRVRALLNIDNSSPIKFSPTSKRLKSMKSLM